MNITIIGAGYVGLPGGAVFAELGHKVWIVRRNKEKVELLKQGISPIYEPGLAELLKKHVVAGNLIPTANYEKAVPSADVVFICVGTPQSDDGRADLGQVFAAAREIAQNLKNYTVVVDKSTVPVGTGDKVWDIISEYAPAGAEFEVASCPEFLREGTAVKDSLHPDRVVIGTDSKRAQNLLLELHQKLPGERVVTDLRTAEIIKYASNAMLATQISFINMIADLCEASNADVEAVAQGLRLDKRIGKHAFLNAGLGYGGGCFPKDVEALIYTLNSYGCSAGILEEVQKVNQERVKKFFQKIAAAGDLKGKIAAIWGLAFKPCTDDLRQSSALRLVDQLLEAGAIVKAFDPAAQAEAKKSFPHLVYCEDIYEAVQAADVLVIATAWPEFKEVDLARLKKIMKNPLIFDGRNIFDPKTMKEWGFKYQSMGR